MYLVFPKYEMITLSNAHRTSKIFNLAIKSSILKFPYLEIKISGSNTIVL